MTLNTEALNDAYAKYRDNPDASHDLYTVCLDTAKQIVNRRIWGDDLQCDRDAIASDIVMDTFLSLPSMKPDRIFAFWFLTLVRNSVSDAITRKYIRPEVSLSWDISGETEGETSYARLREAAGTWSSD